MNLRDESLRLDGYLSALAALEGDGTHFRCVHLGDMEPHATASTAAAAFGLTQSECRLAPVSPSAPGAGTFSSLRSWLLDRIRYQDALGSSVEQRVFDDLMSEIVDVFGAHTELHQLVGTARPGTDLGAIWSIYVAGSSYGSCAIHCSWDS